MRGWLQDEYDVATMRPESEEVRSTLLRILSRVGASAQFVARISPSAAKEDLPSLVTIAYKLAKQDGAGDVIAALAARIGEMDDATAGLLFRASLLSNPSVPAAKRIAARVATLDTEVGRWARSVARS